MLHPKVTVGFPTDNSHWITATYHVIGVISRPGQIGISAEPVIKRKRRCMRDGTAWQATSTVDHRDLFQRAVERAELGVTGVLRHSSIVRALLGGVPIAVAAQQHDTSVREIEAHCAAFILDHPDALTRRTLLDTAAPLIAERGPTLRGVGT